MTEPMTDAELAEVRERLDAAEAARDAALARAMPEPVLMETVEQVEALPEGHYAIHYPGYLTWWAFEKDEDGEDGEWWQRGCECPWPPGDLVGCRCIGPFPLPDIPIPTKQE